MNGSALQPRLTPLAPSLLERLSALAAGRPALPTAVVHPCDAVSLSGAIEAGRRGFIKPLLIGPPSRIEAAAREAGENLAQIEIIPAEHSHAAAAISCQVVREGRAGAMMKGSLHTDELLKAMIDRQDGIRTDRRMSHVFIMQVPGRESPLLITDAAVNIAPDLGAKKDIVQNAIECAHSLGMASPRVAILAAVETVEPSMPATLDAAALSKMAERGQIVGGLVDGPLAFDNAVSEAAVALKHIVSEVAGRADILVAPNIEAGNMLAKQLAYFGGAQAAGIVRGARVPVILTSRADDLQTRLSSCVAALLASTQPKIKPTS